MPSTCHRSLHRLKRHTHPLRVATAGQQKTARPTSSCRSSPVFSLRPFRRGPGCQPGQHEDLAVLAQEGSARARGL
jgi:hypothetical protein